MAMKKLFLILMCLPSLALAALGEDQSAIEKDSRRLKAKSLDLKAQVLANGVSTKSMKVKGTRIKEYFDKTGHVFAIKWDGIREPDLSVLLGPYFPEYKVIDSTVKRGRRHVHSAMQTSKVKVSRGGQAFHLHGLILLKDKLPAGVGEGDLQ